MRIVALIEVTPEAWFDADLGGESLDLLDLGFRCEKAFGVKIHFQDLTAQNLTIGADGTLTAESLHRLSQRFPLLEVSHWTNRKFDRPLQLLTVGDIAAVVESELRASSSIPT